MRYYPYIKSYWSYSFIFQFILYNLSNTKTIQKISKVIVSKPILLVKYGKILEDSMMKARISEDEFESYLRLSGNDDIPDIILFIFRN